MYTGTLDKIKTSAVFEIALVRLSETSDYLLAAPVCALGTPYLLSTGVVLVGHKKAAVEGAGPISSGPRRGRRGVRAGAGLEGESALVTSRAC